MDIQRLKSLLERYTSGTLSHQEENEMEAWYRTFDEQTVKDFLAAYPGEKERLGKEMLAALHGQMAANNRTTVRNMEALSKKKNIYLRSWLTVAACLAILLAGIWIGYYYSGFAANKQTFVTTQTQKGQRSLVTLSDGSKVYLNADSKLIYPAKSKKNSVVYLVGEAYFVVPNENKPLIVKTSGISTSVNSSDFNISAFPDDSVITIAVQKGEAKISSSDKTHPMLSLRMPKKENRPKTVPMAKLIPAHPTLMKLIPVKQAKAKPNEYITYNKSKKIVNINSDVNSKAVFGWKDGIIYFKNADTTELINKLERWYGIAIRLNSKGSSLPDFSGEFQNATLQNVLQHISKQWDMVYSISGKNVYLDKRLN